MFTLVNKFVLRSSIVLFLIQVNAYTQDIALPTPQKTIGMPLMVALNNHRFSWQILPLKSMS